jgi:hypothetical protein
MTLLARIYTLADQALESGNKATFHAALTAIGAFSQFAALQPKEGE